MGFIKRILGGKRRKDRIDIRVPVRIGPNKNGALELWTHDMSESGLRIDLGEGVALMDVTEGNRDVEINIQIKEAEDPISVFAELIWTTRQDDGSQASGWMFHRFLKDGQDRLAALIHENQ
jgi:hypothetical protein